MLGKLMKYELKSTGRLFLPLYGALTAVAIVSRIFSEFVMKAYEDSYYYNLPTTVEVSYGTIQFLYGLLVMATSVLTIVVIVQRFSKNLLSDEGYLMFTLPVKTHQLIFSKLFVGIIWSFASSLATILSFIILNADKYFFKEIYQELQWLFENIKRLGIGAHFTGYVFEWILIILFGSMASILMFYASISLGQLAKKHRSGAAVGAYIGLSTANLFVYVMIITSLFRSEFFYDWLMSIDEYTGVHLVFIFMIFCALLMTVVYYFITNYILTKKLNLE